MTLVIDQLSKSYPPGVHALAGVSLTIAPGMFGLLGPNGAGKSTLMRTIAGLQTPDSGSVRFRDIDAIAEPQRLRACLGYLPQEFGLYPTMTAEEILAHFVVLKGVAGADARRDLVASLLTKVNLHGARHQRVGGFSGGMKQRLGIAIALAGNPQLLIVDEPTAGLDPEERQRFLNLLADVGDDAVVILSTHIVDDVRDVCSQMAILDRGRVVVAGAPATLIDALRGRVWQTTVRRSEVAALKAAHRVTSSTLLAGDAVVHVVADNQPDHTFDAVSPELVDVYFHHLQAHNATGATDG
jgi:ABC-type multidrug transport system ATPase subunit